MSAEAGGKPRVLFVCVGNSCRSQMAEAFARAAGLEAASAGTEPSQGVSSKAVAVMAEVGHDLATHTPKMLEWDALASYDRVITMGCGVAESCPSLRTDEDWGLEDPVDQELDVVRAVRDDIERRVTDLVARLRTA
ncbi:MAG: arsenate reductase ArsC [Thermoplasmatota archaeon]